MQPVLVAVSMVVSERGDRWLPQIAPARIAPSTGRISGALVNVAGNDTCKSSMVIGIAMGGSRPKVAHAEPIAIEQASEVKKNITGRN